MNLKINHLVLGLSVVLVIFVSGCVQQLGERDQKEKIAKSSEEEKNQPVALPLFEKGLGPLCNSDDNCEEFCRRAFHCEAYCLQHPENRHCKERFSFIHTNPEIGHPLMKFPEFRNYKYNFSEGGIVQEEPKLKNIGVNIDFYNPTTNMAGDFVFDTFTYSWGGVYNTKVFADFAETKYDGNERIYMPEVTYIVPLGTGVMAISDGIVTSIKLQETGDVELGITRPENPLWGFGYDHVINIRIKEGDRVEAGDVIGEVSNYSQWLREDGYGVVEISLVNLERGYTPHCPFKYLDESIKQDYLNKISALYKSWEKYIGNSSLYDEENNFMPGCIKEKLE